jgi:hypothetical protein
MIPFQHMIGLPKLRLWRFFRLQRWGSVGSKQVGGCLQPNQRRRNKWKFLSFNISRSLRLAARLRATLWRDGLPDVPIPRFSHASLAAASSAFPCFRFKYMIGLSKLLLLTVLKSNFRTWKVRICCAQTGRRLPTTQPTTKKSESFKKF